MAKDDAAKAECEKKYAKAKKEPAAAAPKKEEAARSRSLSGGRASGAGQGATPQRGVVPCRRLTPLPHLPESSGIGCRCSSRTRVAQMFRS